MKKKYSLNDIKKTLKEKDAFSTVFFVDPIAIRLLYLIANYTKLTPNYITIFSLIIGIVGVLYGFFGYYIISSILFYIAFIFDCMDGKLSRLKGISTKFGYIFDGLVDGTIVLMYNVLILYLLIKNGFYILIIFFFILNYFRLYKDIVLNYFTKFFNYKGIFTKQLNKNSKRYLFIPNDVDIMYFQLIIGTLILFFLKKIGYNMLLLIYINIGIITLFYFLLFLIPILFTLKKLWKLDKNK